MRNITLNVLTEQISGVVVTETGNAVYTVQVVQSSVGTFCNSLLGNKVTIGVVAIDNIIPCGCSIVNSCV